MSIKALREALCRHDTSDLPGDVHLEVTRLIHLLDLHRPLGTDGKHGHWHTPTCGCEDKQAASTMEAADRVLSEGGGLLLTWEHRAQPPVPWETSTWVPAPTCTCTEPGTPDQDCQVHGKTYAFWVDQARRYQEESARLRGLVDSRGEDDRRWRRLHRLADGLRNSPGSTVSDRQVSARIAEILDTEQEVR